MQITSILMNADLKSRLAVMQEDQSDDDKSCVVLTVTSMTVFEMITRLETNVLSCVSLPLLTDVSQWFIECLFPFSVWNRTTFNDYHHMLMETNIKESSKLPEWTNSLNTRWSWENNIILSFKSMILLWLYWENQLITFSC